MKHSIYFRNFLVTAITVLISFSVLGGLSTAWNYRLSTTENRETMLSTLHQTARYIITQYIDFSIDISDLNLSRSLAMISGISGFDLLVTDTLGIVSSCSERDFRNLGKSVPESDLNYASAGTNAVTRSNLGNIYTELRQVAGVPLAVTTDGETVVFGYLYVSSDMDALRQSWRQFQNVYMLIALNVMVVTFAISYVATKKQAEPLKEMADAARRFARGDFSLRVEDNGRLDEISQLTQAFNAMADSVESSETLRREFIANISHEMKTPMTVISGFVEGILDGTIPPEDETRYLRVISSEIKRLSRLISSMLDMSRLQSVNEKVISESRFDATEVVRLALLSLERKIDEKELSVETELPQTPITARGDKDSITQVVYNIIGNAIKFSVQGGVIRLALWKQGGKAYVSVENHGETIPKHELPHIFDRFHKTDKSRSADREGVGLGLYIVKTILDNHNEDVFVTSGNGSTKFVFSLTIVS